MSGLAYIHKQKVIHCDIKPSNLLVTNSFDKPVYKIGDLGSSAIYEGRSKPLKTAGTYLYCSPDIFLAFENAQEEVVINPQIDVFSLGLVILFCLNGKYPCSIIEDYRKYVYEGGNLRIKFYIFHHTSDYHIRLRKVLCEMLGRIAELRPTAENLLEKNPATRGVSRPMRLQDSSNLNISRTV